MSQLQEILAFNRNFVKQKSYLPYIAGKIPRKKIVVVTCMDTRLVELLPKAMNFRNGDVKLIKTAGAYITEPFGGEMRSILIAISVLKAEEVFVVGHHDCGLIGLQANQVIDPLSEKNQEDFKSFLKQPHIQRWLTGPSSVEEGVKASVKMISQHPLFPKKVNVHGLVIHPKTGKLEVVM